MVGIAGEVRRNSSATFTYGLLQHGHTSVGQPTKTYIHQLCADTGYRLENLPRVMANRAKC